MPEYVTLIDHQVCMKCSRCATVCPMDRMYLSQGLMQVTTDPLRYCVGCGHCMAVCPTRAITSAGFDYGKFEDLPDKVACLNELLPLLKSRRSVRHYQEKPVEREVLEKILRAATTAPMGVPPSSVEVIVFDTHEKVQEMVPLLLNELKQWLYAFGNPVTRGQIGLTMNRAMMKMMMTYIIPMTRLILAEAEKGRDVLTYDAPVMMLFHGDKYTISNKENVFIATTFAMIAAEASGLGNCWVGVIPPAIDYSKKLRRSLDIPRNNEVLTSLVMGWPKVTYNRSVPREFESVRWM